MLTRTGNTLEARFHWWTRDDTVAAVSQDGEVVARRPGATWLFATSDSGGRDSARVVVQQAPTRIGVTPVSRSLMRARTLQFAATEYDAMGSMLPPTAAIWWLSDSTIAEVSASGRVTARAVGTTVVHARIGDFHDSTSLTVTPLPHLRLIADTIIIGAGHERRRFPEIVADSMPPDTTIRIAMRVADPHVAWAPDTADHDRPWHDANPVRLVGSSPGTTVVYVSAHGWVGDSTVVVVSPSRLRLMGAETALLTGDHVVPMIGVADAAGHFAPLANPTTVTLTATNPSVLRVSTELLTLAEWVQGRAAALTAGTSQLIVAAPGYASDTVSVVVEERSRRLDIRLADGSSPDSQIVGIDRAIVGQAWLTTPDQGWPVPLTITQVRPDLVTIAADEPAEAVVGGGSVFSLRGLSVGVDTVVFSSPDHRPDTLIVRVTPPHMTISGVPSVTTVYNTIYATPHFWDSVGVSAGNETLGLGRAIRVTSSNPLVLQPIDSLLPIGGGSPPSGSAAIRPVGLGAASLTFIDTTGLHPPVTTEPVVVTTRNLVIHAPPPDSTMRSVGTRQRLPRSSLGDPLGSWFDIPGGLEHGFAVELRTTDPLVATVDPAFIPVVSDRVRHFDLRGGDAPGFTYVVASGLGLVPDSMLVEVSVPTTTLRVPREITLPVGNDNRTYTAVIELRDGYGNPRVTMDDLVFAVTSTDSTIVRVQSIPVIVPAGASESAPFWVAPHRYGDVGIRVEDSRPVPFRYTPQVTAIRIVP